MLMIPRSIALSPNDYSPIDSLCQCIDEINSWMCQNFLQLNKEKTEVIAFGNKDEVFKVNAYLDSRGQTTKNQVRNLGVILETDLSFSSHVKAVTKSAYYHLKNIARIRCFVSSQDLEKLVHAFITSRVDYCNGLLTGLPKKTIRQLQLIQNAAARILTRTRKSSQVTYVTMVPRVGNETLRPLGVATGNALSVTRSEDTYEKTPPVDRRQPMTSLPACHNIIAAGRKHHQLLRLKLASEAWPEA